MSAEMLIRFEIWCVLGWVLSFFIGAPWHRKSQPMATAWMILLGPYAWTVGLYIAGKWLLMFYRREMADFKDTGEF